MAILKPNPTKFPSIKEVKAISDIPKEIRDYAYSIKLPENFSNEEVYMLLDNLIEDVENMGYTPQFSNHALCMLFDIRRIDADIYKTTLEHLNRKHIWELALESLITKEETEDNVSLKKVLNRMINHISQHFTLEELTHSDKAIELGISNKPSELHIINLKSLCVDLLEPVRTLLGKPVSITSGYRSKELNDALPGSAPTSQHMKGEAVDFQVEGMAVEDIFEKLKNSRLTWDQLIQEHDWDANKHWIHISLKGPSSLTGDRKQCLIMNKKNGEKVYTKVKRFEDIEETDEKDNS